jgi:hypothetical protein
VWLQLIHNALLAAKALAQHICSVHALTAWLRVQYDKMLKAKMGVDADSGEK